MRTIRIRPWFREQVVEFRRPKRIAYRMTLLLPGLRHHYGVMAFRPDGVGTLLDYPIEHKARLMLTPALAALIENGIKPGIRRLARQYETSTAAPS